MNINDYVLGNSSAVARISACKKALWHVVVWNSSNREAQNNRNSLCCKVNFVQWSSGASDSGINESSLANDMKCHKGAWAPFVLAALCIWEVQGQFYQRKYCPFIAIRHFSSLFLCLFHFHVREVRSSRPALRMIFVMITLMCLNRLRRPFIVAVWLLIHPHIADVPNVSCNGLRITSLTTLSLITSDAHFNDKIIVSKFVQWLRD